MEQNKKQKLYRSSLSLQKKVEVINSVACFENNREMASHFKCSVATIDSILREKYEILYEWANKGNADRHRQIRVSDLEMINNIVFEWITRARSAQLSISYQMIIDIAKEAKNFTDYFTFRPNKRWMDRLKQIFDLENVDLETPDPSFRTGVGKSLELDDIYEDIKEFSDTENVSESESSDKPCEDIKANSDTKNQQKNDVDSCKKSKSESTGKPLRNIKDNLEALQCLRIVEEYCMLSDNYRALGLIIQLEAIFKCPESL